MSARRCYTLRTAREMGDLSRVILGTDAPAGSGVQPLGILRMVSLLSSLGDTSGRNRVLLRHRQHGPHARAGLRPDRGRPLRGLRHHGHGTAFTRNEHILDSVQLGDLPGIGMTIIDGIIRTQRSRNTPPAGKVPEIVSGH